MIDPLKVRALLERACVAEMDLTPEVARDVSFHMTDWIDDLVRYAKLCENPESHSAEQANEILLAFLLHVPNHIAAAAKLFADFSVTDVFGVGAKGIVSNDDA